MSLLYLLALAVLLGGCAESSQPAVQPRPVKVITATVLDRISKDFAGMATSDDEVNLAFKLSGQVMDITVSEGESVRRGEVLARLDPRDVELRLSADRSAYEEANNTFLVNLLESVAIVIAIIMLVMGFRSGVLIGSLLLFSIGGTLLCMQFIGEGLNRTSLAGFIIAMGMLVDNAIVVIDNARQAMLQGVERSRAFIDGANLPSWSLLGATLIAIFSFLPLYLAPSSVAEIVKPLFVVLSICCCC